ncbi:hypothetical protein KGM_202620 [Danaus plexippus plexippus]|uniref:Uncharacterized protein n=1 Tax=Danaus plexippus plexippus TaxID=278856 RepID=A0A212EIX3_DANPL|nr:uncharacterized protein LOC116769336 [Danaus plexippus plexippus]OWR41436.1 hypothetical protein KGM_202620 [Danaus plexippus plexippus]
MLKIIIIASIVSTAFSKQYAYIDNNLVEFADPTPLPYPYQEVNPLNASQQSKSGIQTAVSLGQVVPNVETEAVVESPLSVIGSLVLSAIGCLKRIFVNIITTIPTLVFSLFGIYNFASLCKYFNVQTILSKTELGSFMTTDKLKRAVEFVETAINKYNTVQNYKA